MQELESRSTSAEIKLYEFDYDKPELSEETLEHHGILGMRWGHRNGPPYPLSSDVSTGKKLKSGKSPSKHKARKIQKKRVKTLKKARKAKAEKQKLEQEQKKTKEEIIKTKDISAMLKDVDSFSNQELRDMFTRLDIEGELKKRVHEKEEAQKSSGRKFVDSVVKSTKEGVSKGVSSTASLVAENAAKMGIKKMVEAAGGTSENAQDIIDKLFKEKKK